MGNREPLVSIIIPVYNKIQTLEKTITSITSQSFCEYECILVDDGSTDGSSFVCDRWAKKDHRFTVVHIIPNSGVSHARNEGMRKAQGKYITFVDADDLIPEDYIECLYNNIITSRADLVSCSVTKVWKDGTRQNVKMPANGVYAFSELLPQFASLQKESGIYGVCCGKIFLRELVNNVVFDERLHLAEDFDFFLKMYSKTNHICFSDETSYYYYQEQANSSAIVLDDEIDYRAQLSINLRYKHFLDKNSAYNGKNEEIVSQLISNYTFYTLFYCDLKKLKKVFADLSAVCQNEHVILQGRSVFEKWILELFSLKQRWLVGTSLAIYRVLKRVERKGK